MNTIDWQAECALDPALQFAPVAEPVEAPPPPSTSSGGGKPQTIFLTGTTGFVGLYLLAELARKTSATLHCLVRCATPEEGMARLQERLRFHQLWQPELEQRIRIVPGDLAQPGLGLEPARFAELADTIELIYHSGAFVNFTRPYAVLKPANVEGSREILRLAAMSRTKPLHFVSTIAVFAGAAPGSEIRETDSPEIPPPGGGYNQSKWVAEQLVRQARERGLPAMIYRPPGIFGAASSGIIDNLEDPWCAFIKGCVLLGCYPDVENRVGFVPVDFVSRTLVDLSLHTPPLPEPVEGAGLQGKDFNLLNPNPPVSWDSLFSMINRLGHPLRKVSYEDWRAAVRQAVEANPGNRLYAHLLWLPHSPLFALKPRFIPSLENAVCPVLDEDLLARYFKFFYRVGFLAAPG